MILVVHKRNLPNHSILDFFNRLLVNGLDGSFKFGQLGRNISKGLTMKEFGDCVGLCMHFQGADEVAEDIADIELQKSPKKKKGDLVTQFKKDMNLAD
jgi:hypothetical protein